MRYIMGLLSLWAALGCSSSDEPLDGSGSWGGSQSTGGAYGVYSTPSSGGSIGGTGGAFHYTGGGWGPGEIVATGGVVVPFTGGRTMLTTGGTLGAQDMDAGVDPNTNDPCGDQVATTISINPTGDSGSISGWQANNYQLSFEQQIPYFSQGEMEQGDVSTIWFNATSTLTGPSAQFSSGTLSASTYRVAVAEGATSFANIDRNALVFSQGMTRPLRTGEIIVLDNTDNDVSVAIRIGALDNESSETCATLSLSWTFTF